MVRQRPAKPCTRVRFPSPPPRLGPARLAQRESASLTRKRSLVQSQYRAPRSMQVRGGFQASAQGTCPIRAQWSRHARHRDRDTRGFAMNTNTAHDDNATTWRDLADQLTPKQVAELELQENEALAVIAAGRNPRESLQDIARGFLNEARWTAQQTSPMPGSTSRRQPVPRSWSTGRTTARGRGRGVYRRHPAPGSRVSTPWFTSTACRAATALWAGRCTSM